MFVSRFFLTILFLINFSSIAFARIKIRFCNDNGFKVSKSIMEIAEKQKQSLKRQSVIVKKYVLRNKGAPAVVNNDEMLDKAHFNPYNWQVGKGYLSSVLPAIYTSGVKHQIRTKDGIKINAIFHERPGAESIVFVAPGFGNSVSMYTPLLWIFEKASIVFFDFRGHGSNLYNSLIKKNYWERKLKLPFSATETKLGKREELEVEAVVSYFKKMDVTQNYKRFVGMGFCFGAAMMVKAQAKNPRLFTHLILDSLWPKYSKLVQIFLQDPSLLFRPQKNPGGFWNYVFSHKIIHYPFKIFLEKFVFKQSLANKLDICRLLKVIKIPIFFIYGKKDALIRPKDFELIWSSVLHKRKVALVSDYKHLLTFLKDKELYRVCSELFLNKISEM